MLTDVVLSEICKTRTINILRYESALQSVFIKIQLLPKYFLWNEVLGGDIINYI